MRRFRWAACSPTVAPCARAPRAIPALPLPATATMASAVIVPATASGSIALASGLYAHPLAWSIWAHVCLSRPKPRHLRLQACRLSRCDRGQGQEVEDAQSPAAWLVLVLRRTRSWSLCSGSVVQWHQFFFPSSFFFGPTKNGLPQNGLLCFLQGH